MPGKRSAKKTISDSAQKLNRLWCAKKKRRRSLAALPIKEKVKILIKLQEAAYPILAKRNKNQLRPWKI